MYAQIKEYGMSLCDVRYFVAIFGFLSFSQMEMAAFSEVLGKQNACIHFSSIQIKVETEETSLRDFYEQPSMEDVTVKEEPVESEEEDKLVINEPMKDEPPEEDEEEMPLVSKKEPEELPEDDDEDDMPLVSVLLYYSLDVEGKASLSSTTFALHSSVRWLWDWTDGGCLLVVCLDLLGFEVNWMPYGKCT